MKAIQRHKFLISSGIIVLFAIVWAFWQRDLVFSQIARYLVVEKELEKSDVIAVLRGDRNYSRALEAAHLFKDGYSDCIFISTELIDKSSKKLKMYGVELPSEQERLKSILIQLGIPKEKVVVGNREPGGGTQGEVGRIRAIMLEQNFKKAIIVTSWYHTRRTNTICKRVFDGTDISIFVKAARNDISKSTDWWKYRYEAINVLEEFPKLVFLYLGFLLNISFSDDPIDIQAMPSK